MPSKDPVLAEMTKRGIGAGKARELLAGREPEKLIDQLEWGDHLVSNARNPIVNPAGFYIHLVTAGVIPPEDFETSRIRKGREEAQREASVAQLRRHELENAYREYRAAELERHINAHVRPEDLERMISDKLKEIRKGWSRELPMETLRDMAQRAVRSAIAETLPIQTFEEFIRNREGGGVQGTSMVEEA